MMWRRQVALLNQAMVAALGAFLGCWQLLRGIAAVGMAEVEGKLSRCRKFVADVFGPLDSIPEVPLLWMRLCPRVDWVLKESRAQLTL